MFQKAIILAVIFLSAIFQVAILPNFFPPGMMPNLALVLVAIWTIRERFEMSLPKTILAGFLFDLANGWAIGITVFALVVVSYGISFAAKRFLISQKTWRTITLVLIIVLSSVIFDIIIIAFYRIFNLSAALEYLNYGNAISVSGIKIFSRMAFSLLIFAILYWPINNLEKFLDFYGQRIAPKEKTFLRR